ncbi:MAG TPA: hypothetical protein VH120_00070, partial [Gemmataceae bacterium]|nr:hypothetical protein [Gemmataceae bacterium]
GLGFGPDMVHAYRGATAIDGVCYYGADQFPEYYRNGFFLGEVVNSRVNFFTLKRDGGTYTAMQQADFITSSDGWFRPVDIKLGPDGAIYIADFYNRIIGHYEVPLTHPGRDRTSGRIWRIVYRGTDGKAPPPQAPRQDWTKATVDELLQDLAHPNLTVRMLATHQWVERGLDAIAAKVAALGRNSPPTVRAHALWILERLGVLDEAIVKAAAKDGELLVRVHLLRILAERPKLTKEESAIVQDALRRADDGLVRRVAAEALGRHPDLDARRELLDVLEEWKTAADPFLRHTLRIALREQFRGRNDWTVVRLPDRPSMTGIALGQPGAEGIRSDIAETRDRDRDRDRPVLADIAVGLPEPGATHYLASVADWLGKSQPTRLADCAHHVARYAELDQPGQFVAFIRAANSSDAQDRGPAVLLALLRGFQERGSPPPAQVTDCARDQCSTLFSSHKPDDLRAAIELAAALRSRPMQANVLRILIDRQKPEAVRVAALNGLAAFDPKELVDAVARRLADAGETVTFREKVAQHLAGVNAPEARAALLAALPTAPARLASVIASGLAGTPEGATALLDAIAAG